MERRYQTLRLCCWLPWRKVCLLLRLAYTLYSLFITSKHFWNNYLHSPNNNLENKEPIDVSEWCNRHFPQLCVQLVYRTLDNIVCGELETKGKLFSKQMARTRLWSDFFWSWLVQSVSKHRYLVADYMETRKRKSGQNLARNSSHCIFYGPSCRCLCWYSLLGNPYFWSL